MMTKYDPLPDLLEFLRYFIFFSFFFFSFTLYRSLILKEYGVSYVHYGYGIFEAFVLSKTIMLGKYFNLGDKFKDRSLILPTVYKTLIFTLLVLFLTVLEHFFLGYLRGKHMELVFNELLQSGLDEILAKIWIMSFVFLFFFAFSELGRVMGNNKLFNLFFRRNHSDLE